jgi:hypothetical protein
MTVSSKAAMQIANCGLGPIIYVKIRELHTFLHLEQWQPSESTTMTKL